MPSGININDNLSDEYKSSKSRFNEMSKNSLIILPQLKEFFWPLNETEYYYLKESIIDEGIREPIAIFYNEYGQKVLLDGHYRYAIFHEIGGESNGYELEEVVVDIDTFEDAKKWRLKVK